MLWGTGGHEADAGAVLVDRYYYAKDPGNKDEKGIYWVDRVDTSSPTFHDDVKFVIRTDLYEDGVLDFAPLREELDDSGVGRTGLTVTSNFIDDGITGDYLIGLGEHLEVLVVYIDSEGYPSKYAVLPSTLDGRGPRPRNWGSVDLFDGRVERCLQCGITFLLQRGQGRLYHIPITVVSMLE